MSRSAGIPRAYVRRRCGGALRVEPHPRRGSLHMISPVSVCSAPACLPEHAHELAVTVDATHCTNRFRLSGRRARLDQLCKASWSLPVVVDPNFRSWTGQRRLPVANRPRDAYRSRSVRRASRLGGTRVFQFNGENAQLLGANVSRGVRLQRGRPQCRSLVWF